MPDPLAVAQISAREALEHLELIYQSLRDADVKVSVDGVNRSRELRRKLRQSQAGFSRETAREVVAMVLKAIAEELLKLSIETFIRYLRKTRNEAATTRWKPSPELAA